MKYLNSLDAYYIVGGQSNDDTQSPMYIGTIEVGAGAIVGGKRVGLENPQD